MFIAEKAMATHSSTLAWKIPWTEGPGGLQSMGSLGVRHDWATSLFLLSCIGEGNDNPLQCSCLKNPRDGGARWAAVCGVAQSRTRLSNWTEVLYGKREKSLLSTKYFTNIETFYNLHYSINTAAAAAKLLQSCPTLCDPTDGSPPGSPVPGILQARTLEWVVISFSNAWK